MYDLIIRNGCVVTVNQAKEVLPDASVAIKNGRIARIIAAEQELPQAKEVVDASGKIVMPGLINAHCHAADSLFRGLVENLSLEDWLQQVWVAEKAILTEQTCKLGSLLGLAENLRGGVTTVIDMFWYPHATVDAANELGMKICTGGLFFDPPGVGGRKHADFCREAEGFFAQYATTANVYTAAMPHGTYTVSPEHLQEAGQLCQKYAGLFHTHAAETAFERNDIKQRYGATVIRHLAKLELLSARTLLAHCVHVDAEEIDLLASTKTAVVHNPLSNLKLGSGFAPVAKMLEAGVLVSLGTDGAISGNDLDMWLAMRLAATLPKGTAQQADLVSAQQVLEMATINGAKVLGVQERIGSIEVGKQADLIMVDTAVINAVPLFDAVTHLVYSAGRGDVTDVFINGIPRVRNREIVDFELSEVLNQVKQLSPAILAALGRT